MKKNTLFLLLALMALMAFAQQDTKVYYIDGLYYADKARKEIYTGDYKEYYPDGTLKMEIFIREGKPEGPYVIYHPTTGRIKEIRSYKNGLLHGTWRTYSEYGVMLSQAAYVNDKKDGEWLVWNEMGVKLYEMHYDKGKRVGVWKMWDEDGHLISEKAY